MNGEEPKVRSGIGWLRVVVWLMPTAMFVGLIFAEGRVRIPVPGLIQFGVFLALVGCLACSDALLHCRQIRIPPGARPKKVLWSVVFIVGQFALAPFVFVVIATIGSSSA
jgi:hypothetical protein